MTELRLHHYFENSAGRVPDAVALECHGQTLTYRQLDERANQAAHHLVSDHGISPGDRVGIMIERSVPMYAVLLGVQKAGATFVPIDPSAPVDRVAYISSDSDLALIVTTSDLAPACEEADTPVLLVDRVADRLAAASASRPVIEVTGDPLCYIIYTSGSTGRPKGVEIAQSSITNFIDVVPEIYGVTQSERVYQGMTISFDFSIEEIWPTWAVGATLVAGPTDGPAHPQHLRPDRGDGHLHLGRALSGQAGDHRRPPADLHRSAAR